MKDLINSIIFPRFMSNQLTSHKAILDLNICIHEKIEHINIYMQTAYNMIMCEGIQKKPYGLYESVPGSSLNYNQQVNHYNQHKHYNKRLVIV